MGCLRKFRYKQLPQNVASAVLFFMANTNQEALPDGVTSHCEALPDTTKKNVCMSHLYHGRVRFVGSLPMEDELVGQPIKSHSSNETNGRAAIEVASLQELRIPERFFFSISKSSTLPLEIEIPQEEWWRCRFRIKDGKWRSAKKMIPRWRLKEILTKIVRVKNQKYLKPRMKTFRSQRQKKLNLWSSAKSGGLKIQVTISGYRSRRLRET